MKQAIAGVGLLAAIVVGFVLVTSLGSPAQEPAPSDETTTTTVPEDRDRSFRGRFGLGFGGDLSEEVDDFLACLEEHGIAVPDQSDRGFFFDLRSEDFDGLAEALEECGLPGMPFRDGFPEGFPFLDELPEGFPFGGELPEGFLDELPKGFPFGERFGDGLPEGFPFGGRFEFRGPLGVDRDELAECLAELGSFDSVDEVREKLDECLPERPVDKFFDFEFDFEQLVPEDTSA